MWSRTVPAVSRISSIHCCPSTSTCCNRTKMEKQTWICTHSFQVTDYIIYGIKLQKPSKTAGTKLGNRSKALTHWYNKDEKQHERLNLTKAAPTFLYESSIVGSYFSTKIPCTNWTVCKKITKMHTHTHTDRQHQIQSHLLGNKHKMQPNWHVAIHSYNNNIGRLEWDSSGWKQSRLKPSTTIFMPCDSMQM